MPSIIITEDSNAISMTVRIVEVPADFEQMVFPVQCLHCGGVYDKGRVTVTARHADCSVWNAPCCGRQVDDRGEIGLKRPDYADIDRSKVRVAA